MIVLAPFELQCRLNERLVTAEAYALIRFQLERAVAESADVCVAPSRRFVENAVRTGAAAQGSRFVVLPEIEAVRGVGCGVGSALWLRHPGCSAAGAQHCLFCNGREAPSGGVTRPRRPDTSARRGVRAARRARGVVRGAARGTEVTWTIGRRNAEADAGEAMLFVPYCEDFFALGASLAAAVHGAPVLVGTGSAVGEPFEAAGVAVEPFPDVVARVQRAEVAMRRGDWALAGEWWEELRRAFPDHVSGYVRGAEALLQAGRLEEVKQAVSSCEAVRAFSRAPRGSCVQRR